MGDELQVWKSCIENGEMSSISETYEFGMWKSCLENGGRSWSLWCIIEKLTCLMSKIKKTFIKYQNHSSQKKFNYNYN